MEEKKRYRDLFQKWKCCVIIPTYNNSETILDVIDGVSDYTSQLIVVNDGSTDKTRNLLAKYKENRIDIIGYSSNRGKGFALRKGFRRAIELGYDYAITIDSDGQHMPSDLPAFIDRLEQTDGSIIVGERKMPEDNVPAKNTFANKFSNFWFRLYTGKKLRDTQCGYRLYPLRQIEPIRFYSTKYEFEIEVLVRSSWNGIKIDSIPVEVYYPPDGERVSHFRPVRDFIRIGILNTIFFFITFFYIKPFRYVRELRRMGFKKAMKELFLTPSDSNSKLSFSVTLGVFCGVLPIWGWQLAVAIFLAYVLRLNKMVVITTANISIPPMIPFILYLSYITGGLILGDNATYIKFSTKIDFNLVMANLYQYVIGSLVFGAFLSILLGGITFLSLSVFRKPQEDTIQKAAEN